MRGKATVCDILLVDDEADIREIAALSLQIDASFRVRECATGAEAIEAVLVSCPDLILLDVMMPTLDGQQTFAELQRLTPHCPPVIFLTARTLPSDVDRLMALGAVGVIAKPFDPMRLAGQVRDAWQRRHAA